MPVDFTNEIKFNTSRSGGSGGQNVNKVETKVEAYWQVVESMYFSDVQKKMIGLKLQNQINATGNLLVKSSRYRNQLSNKQEVIKKMHELVTKALHSPPKRKPTKVPAGVIKKRAEIKQRQSTTKQNRRKPDIHLL